MRVSTILVAAAGAAASVVLAAGPAVAGEINGTGNPPGGEGLGSAPAPSICAVSGGGRRWCRVPGPRRSAAPELGPRPAGGARCGCHPG